MANASRVDRREPWRQRLLVPNYQVGEAARYAQISAQTVAKWHSISGSAPLLTGRARRTGLSYMQLVEVAVVAAFRKSGVSLRNIREAREYASKVLASEYPFAEYRFKSDGKTLLMDYAQIIGEEGGDKLLELNKKGQLAWKEFIDERLHEFDYDDGGVVVRWHVRGADSPVIVDPRLCFGTPNVFGVPTWVLKSRWMSGEKLNDIAEDFSVSPSDVIEALKFEGIQPE